MTLVETILGETDAEFRTAVDAALQDINPSQSHWWHPYEVRDVYECLGIRFRHFYCSAGSVECWIWSIAVNRGGPRRVILMPSESATVLGSPKIYGHGKEILISACEVKAVAI
jgi:hypothetical protein